MKLVSAYRHFRPLTCLPRVPQRPGRVSFLFVSFAPMLFWAKLFPLELWASSPPTSFLDFDSPDICFLSCLYNIFLSVSSFL